MSDRPTVLFICAHNANRSQVAAGYLERLAGGNVNVLSAGPSPSPALNPAAVEVMHEEGIDIGSKVPRRLTAEVLNSADLVVTLGCPDAATGIADGRHVDWDLEDYGRDLAGARGARDEIKHRVQELIRKIATSTANS